MVEYSGYNPLFSCRNCLNPLASRLDLLSKNYLAKSGQAYLFENVKNVVVGESREKELITGLYTVADISCNKCGEILGWKYVRAYGVRDKFKQGKFILETAKIVKEY